MTTWFYPGQEDYITKLNELGAIADLVSGPDGWSPVLAVVSDGSRRVLRIVDWVGGETAKPSTGGYIGSIGIVGTAAQAIDIRGPQGATGNTGPANSLSIGTVTSGASASATIIGTAPTQQLNLVLQKGDKGFNGWNPTLSVVTDGSRRVLQIVDWVGGEGTKPATGEYVGATGLVATIAQAVDIRGPSGAGTGNVNPTGVIAANDLAAFADSTGNLIKAVKPANLPVSTATQAALDGKQASLGFTPVQQGGGTGQGSNKVYIGWAADASGLLCQVDVTNFGNSWPISITKNAATATKLATARTINGVSFDGSANISVSVAWSSVTGKPAVIAAGADAAAARSAIGAGTSNLADAPSDGKTYGRKDAAWSEVVTNVGDVTQTGTQTLANKTIHGNVNTLTADGTNEVGFRHIPQNSQSAAYTLVLADAGKHILHPAADTTARTFTIPANSAVAFPIGTAITFINQNGTDGVVTITITADIMRLAGAGTTGSRTLARNGIATAIKIAATEWIISGTNLT